MFSKDAGNSFANLISSGINTIEYVLNGTKYRQKTTNSVTGNNIYFNITISNKVGTITKLTLIDNKNVEIDSYNATMELKTTDDMFIQIKYNINTGVQVLNFSNNMEVK